jgi:hypothetical protein
MLANLGRLLAGVSLLAAGVVLSAEPAPSPSSPKHTLRYRFRPGETVSWQVQQKMNVDTTVSGNTMQVELTTTSLKVWRVVEVLPDGSATFENSADDVDMRRKAGRTEVHFNSKTDKDPPPEYKEIAETVGVPLSRITIDPRGKVLKREHLKGSASDSEVTLPLPDGPIAEGESWKTSFEMTVAIPKGLSKKVTIQQVYTLDEVKDNVAMIRAVTQILTPINDPLLETLVIQKETSGTIRFDLASGRVLEQQMKTDKKAFGFSGGASVYHYRNQFTETLVDSPKTAAPKVSADAPQEPKRLTTTPSEPGIRQPR